MTFGIRKIFVFSIILSISIYASGQKSWKEITSVKHLNENYPDLIQKMLNQFNLDYLGLERVKTAYENDDILNACNFLLEYYKTASASKHLIKYKPIKTNKTDLVADTILKNIFTVQTVKGQVPWNEDGHRDWYYKGPNNDAEWAWLSNRHEQLEQVFEAYLETENPKYVNYIDQFFRDFIIKSLPYPSKRSSGSIWRGLEVSFRNKRWTRLFFGLINNEQFSPATQLLILSSLPDHGDYNRNYHARGNWLTMELSGLAVVASNFPEYKKSNEWLDYAIDKMSESIKHQVYPDGVQKELASHYHHVALENFEEFKNTCEIVDKKMPDSYTKTLETMYDYLAKSVRPNGYGALTNDSDLNNNRNALLKAAIKYKRPDWEYIASNGKTGIKPKDKGSHFYSWGGQLISRSNYSYNAHWSLFDIGPWGTGHEHSDKLHLSISAYGKDFLVDSGRFAYTGEVAKKFRAYAIGSASHNVILIDSKGQDRGPSEIKSPLSNDTYKITDEFDFATNSFESYKGLEGKAKHIRSVFYVRGKFWVVVDRIETDRPRQIEALWHWHPNRKVEHEETIVKTGDLNGNLAIIPVGKKDFKIELIKGREFPTPQGWYSSEYNVFEPNVASSYVTTIKNDATFVWILQPYEKEMTEIMTKITSENRDEIKIEVKSKKNRYQINIPYYNSNKATLIKK
ncbi:alginate lyase family protein [Flavivirga rizhaonensis]|uniref:Alginate lyase family protein n=1 Tax=Flavivirga rizhaonensis TaxID=2559571 RepID=A0A4S1DUQ6_9FLAO|nr:alginate lyase family protein [Flavivirga rizhaonensis]TGV01810.1 alginate lyase family protein [Flavivirga rizhaonensis]